MFGSCLSQQVRALLLQSVTLRRCGIELSAYLLRLEQLTNVESQRRSISSEAYRDARNRADESVTGSGFFSPAENPGGAYQIMTPK